jgi:hypothetical protein
MLSPLYGFRLLLPALLPSWRFFDRVTASPRLDYALLPAADAPAGQWQPFRPPAPRLTPAMMLRRLFWNASWNESLYLVSLAERLVHDASAATEAHSQRELLLRVARHLDRHGACDRDAFLQIRLRFVRRAAAPPGRAPDAATGTDAIVEDIAYLSAPHPIAALVTP